MIAFNEESRRDKLWKMLKSAIFTPFPEEQRRFLRLIEITQQNKDEEFEKLKEEDYPTYLKTNGNKFPFYFMKVTGSQYDQLIEAGFLSPTKAR